MAQDKLGRALRAHTTNLGSGCYDVDARSYSRAKTPKTILPLSDSRDGQPKQLSAQKFLTRDRQVKISQTGVSSWATVARDPIAVYVVLFGKPSEQLPARLHIQTRASTTLVSVFIVHDERGSDLSRSKMSIRKEGLEKPRDLAVIHQHHHRVQQHQPCSRKRVWTVPLITSIIGVAAVYHFLSTFLPLSTTPVGDLTTLANTHNVAEAFDGYDWAALQPSRKLEWQKCYDGKFDCARLDVPLDWLEPSDDDRVALAVMRAPAQNTRDYKGPVFVNPGGPGGSGVSWLEEGIAEHMQTIVGDDHDIVSWDPRGVGASVPRIDCWGSSRKRHDWAMQMSGVVDSHPGMLFDALAQFDALSRQCETYMNATTPGVLSHISTASHARDMLEISEQMGYRKLKYWGVSYGTILGGTFAAMYPDRVERLVSDGNVDYKDWYANVQLNYLEDADKIMEAFFEFCNRAGPDKCAFHEPTAKAIEERFLALLSSLRKMPVLIPAGTNGTQLEMPELVTYSKLQNLIRGCMYKPIYRFPQLASAMAALEMRDGVPYYQLRNEDEGGPPTPPVGFCAVNGSAPAVPPALVPEHSEDAFAAIMCADGEAVPADEWTPEAFETYFEELQRISRYAGASNAQSKLSCAGRTVRPKWRYEGGALFANISTAFPLLFIGNMADNVTPLRSARRNAASFAPGSSAVLVQKSYGHCSFAAPSTCTARVVRAYFRRGELPEPGLECEQDWELFADPLPVDMLSADEDAEFGLAVRELSRKANAVFR